MPKKEKIFYKKIVACLQFLILVFSLIILIIAIIDVNPFSFIIILTLIIIYVYFDDQIKQKESSEALKQNKNNYKD
ncbi:MAG: hypothetical protein ACTSQG_11140 [Promethearchaeota archaeon]